MCLRKHDTKVRNLFTISVITNVEHKYTTYELLGLQLMKTVEMSLVLCYPRSDLDSSWNSAGKLSNRFSYLLRLKSGQIFDCTVIRPPPPAILIVLIAISASVVQTEEKKLNMCRGLSSAVTSSRCELWQTTAFTLTGACFVSFIVM